MTWVVIPVVVLMATAVWLIGMRWLRIRTRDRVHCQVLDGDFNVDFVRLATPAWGGGEKVDVKRCTAFDDPEHIGCSKDCIYWREAVAARHA